MLALKVKLITITKATMVDFYTIACAIQAFPILKVRRNRLVQGRRFDIGQLGIEAKGKIIADLDVGALVTHAVRKGEGELSRTGTLVIKTKEDHPK